eukprot:6456047-Amphidinium_carterae.1
MEVERDFCNVGWTATDIEGRVTRPTTRSRNVEVERWDVIIVVSFLQPESHGKIVKVDSRCDKGCWDGNQVGSRRCCSHCVVDTAM